MCWFFRWATDHIEWFCGLIQLSNNAPKMNWFAIFELQRCIALELNYRYRVRRLMERMNRTKNNELDPSNNAETIFSIERNKMGYKCNQKLLSSIFAMKQEHHWKRIRMRSACVASVSLCRCHDNVMYKLYMVNGGREDRNVGINDHSKWLFQQSLLFCRQSVQLHSQLPSISFKHEWANGGRQMSRQSDGKNEAVAFRISYR